MAIRRTFEEIELIYKDHVENKLTLAELSRKYGFDPTYQFKKYNLETFNWRKLDLNKNREIRHAYRIINNLKEINTEEKAYILGLWMSDGWICGAQASIKLNEKDHDILQQIQDYLCPDNTLKKESKNTYRLTISSQEFCNDLINLGCIPNKTYSEMKVPKMPKELLRHFIRGYFDGDGTVFMDRKWLRSNICSICESFLIELQEILTENNIESRINVEIRENKRMKTATGYCDHCKNMYRLYISKQAALEKFRKFLYEGATIYIKRKHDKFFPETLTELQNSNVEVVQRIEDEPTNIEYNSSKSTRPQTDKAEGENVC